MSRLRPRSAYDVLALLAFFIVLAGGVAYAAQIGAADIADNAIRSRHIAPEQVTNPDLAANSVGTRNVIDGSLRAADLNAGHVPEGATSVNMHVPNSTGSGPGPSYHGIQISFTCTGAGDPNMPVSLDVHGPVGSTIYVIGTQLIGGQPSAVRNGAGSSYTVQTTGGKTSVGLDAIARLVPDGKWAHFQLTGHWNGTEASGCDFGGLLTPYSN